MNKSMIATIIFSVVLLLAVGYFYSKKQVTKRPLNTKFYQRKWLEILESCKSTEGVSLAVINADKLLDDVLKKRHYRGRTMGERLVSAQRDFSNNDLVWFAHKLRNKLVHETSSKLNKTEAKKALGGIRQGLKDLGAL